MYNINCCPQCSQYIPDSRMNEPVVICPHCGWSYGEEMHRVDNSIQRNVSYTVMAICVMMVTSFIMVVNWDKHAISIVPLKLKQWSGVASKDNLERIATICKSRGKPVCIEEAYEEMNLRWPKNQEVMAEYAKILAYNSNHSKAILVFDSYFKSGITNSELAYNFAQTLAQVGQTEKAVKYFEIALRGKPDVLQITVLRNYVSFLIENGEYQRARRVIMKTRRIGINAREFMQKELKLIKKELKRVS